ncbi:imm11 family protein [Vibrio neptunius]|uniref:imm11 family protein n=1 Tax=Vibrio neptunius TaxID=170651 RepID=UPI003CE49E2A
MSTLNIYDESYYIIFPDDDFEEYDNDLTPTQYTANTHWYFEKLNFGIKPLTFVADNEDLDFLQQDYAIAFNVPNFIVTTKLKELLEDGLYGSQFFPAIIQDESNNAVEGLWALNTFQRLDCIDLKRSQYFMPGDGTTEIDGFAIKPDMDNYRFREDVFDAIPEDERLIFQVGNTTTGEIFVHQKVVDIFKKYDVKGIRFFKASEYHVGDEFNVF